MKSSALAAGLALLAFALPSLAQEIALPSIPSEPPSLPAPPAGPVIAPPNFGAMPPCPPAMVLEEPMLVGNPVTRPQYPHMWVDTDYMLWWLKPNNINAPLVTSTRTPENLASSTQAGGLSDPNTVVLFGQQSFRTDPQMGGNVAFNAALDTEGTIVVQASGFFLPMQVERFLAQSNGQEALALPFAQVSSGATVETSSIVAGPFGGNNLNGSVLINNGTEMWGGELNLLTTLASTWAGEFDMIYGARYLYLRDYLTIDASTDLSQGGGSTHDSFDARNAFYGGQIGLHYVYDCDNWRIEASTKVALGDTNEQLDISGSSVLPPYATGSHLPGGFYTASSNIGNHSGNRLGVVMDSDVKLAYKISDCVQLSIGYTFLYWDRVERSGNQVEHGLNPSLNPAFSTITPAGGPAAPERLNAQSDFWAQGITAGLRISF